MTPRTLTTVLGVLLIAAGAIGLAKGEFSYTKETHEASVAGVEFSIKEREVIAIPQWVAGGAVVAGVLLLVSGLRR